MFALLLQAIALATRPDSTETLTEFHLKNMKKYPPPQNPTRPPKKVRRWKGIYEHKDTPIHHH
jgi:hypothetical protein